MSVRSLSNGSVSSEASAPSPRLLGIDSADLEDTLSGEEIECESYSYASLCELVRLSKYPSFARLRGLTIRVNAAKWDEGQDDLLAIALGETTETNEQRIIMINREWKYVKIIVAGKTLFTRRDYLLVSTRVSGGRPDHVQQPRSQEKADSKVTSNPKSKALNRRRLYVVQPSSKSCVKALLRIRNVLEVLIEGPMERSLKKDLEVAMASKVSLSYASFGCYIADFISDTKVHRYFSDEIVPGTDDRTFASMSWIRTHAQDVIDLPAGLSNGLAESSAGRGALGDLTNALMRKAATDKGNRVAPGWESSSDEERINDEGSVPRTETQRDTGQTHPRST